MAVPTRHDIHHDPHRYDGLADRATAAEQCTPLTLALLQPRSDQRLGPRRPLTGVGSRIQVCQPMPPPGANTIR